MNKKKDFVFKPRARLLLQLGDQLIKNESIAVLELVKNAYDADASFCSVEMKNIDDPSKGEIIVFDDGIGMDLGVIEDAWLEPGSDHKEKKFKKEERTENFNRLPIGEKGIGRFGVHKLGKQIVMITRKKSHNEIVVKINWEEFASGNKYLHKIPIDISNREPELFIGDETGTKIIISDLRQEWDRGRVRKLYKSLFALNSPFREQDAFEARLEVSDEDKIEWLEGLIQFEEVKELALYYFEVKIEGGEVKEFKYEFTPWENMHEVDSRIIDQEHRFIKEAKKLKKEVEYEDEETGRTKTKEVDLILDKKVAGQDQKIGPIEFRGYIFDRDQTILNMFEDGSVQQFKQYLNENGGIRVYRDNIRINEYGEKGNDWLNLDISRVNVPGEKISNNQILGIINLNREDSTSLMEKTNREGFVENDAYEDFREAILYVLERLILKLRNTDKSILREKYNQSSVSEPVTDRLEDLRNVVKDKVHEEGIRSEIESLIEKIEAEYKEINEILLTSAGAGLSLSMVLHEIEKIISELNHAVKKEKISNKILDLAHRLSGLVESYGDILRQSTQDHFSLKKLVKGSLFNIEYRIDAHEVEITDESSTFTGNDNIICSKRLVLSSIMNVIDNSIYWLEQKKSQLSKVEDFSKKIFIKIIDDDKKYLKLLIADNGKGFTMPKNRIVKPFVSEKKDGMGLGMHITNEVMKILKGGLEFPEYGDYSVPYPFKSGAQVLFKFRKA